MNTRFHTYDTVQKSINITLRDTLLIHPGTLDGCVPAVAGHESLCRSTSLLICNL